MLRRNIEPRLADALADTAVVFLNGPRQAGKSTLARTLNRTYLTMDDATVLGGATADAEGLVGGLGDAVVLDEVQRAPNLFLAIKAAVDRDRRPGRFLLTGSADLMLLPRLSEALVGRMETVTLWPFSQGEREGLTERFIDTLFKKKAPVLSWTPEPRRDVIDRVVKGGFPEAVARPSEARRNAWYRSYLSTILQRDAR